MRALVGILILAALALGSSQAQVITSHSRQFMVHGGNPDAPVDRIPPGSVLVQADLLAVTAERVRSALAAEIPALAISGGRTIHLNLMRSAPAQTPIGIVSTRFADGWRYQVAVPPTVEEARLVKALVQVLMVEFANRAPGRGAEIPAWVVEGVAQQLFFSVGPKLVVDQNSSGWQVTIRDMQRRTREAMRTNETPTFQQLTMSAPPPANSPPEALYQSGTHLLVSSLLQAPNGRRRFAAFLQLLPQTWNWQTAFRQAYGFERMLDVEKWWALTALEFATRDQRQAWSTETSLQKLEELLNTKIEARNSPKELPELRVIDLKTLLREENWSLQRDALAMKVMQLTYTIPHLAPPVAVLAMNYRRALETYIQKRDRADVATGLRSTPEARRQALVSELKRRIESLDAKRREIATPTLTARQ